MDQGCEDMIMQNCHFQEQVDIYKKEMEHLSDFWYVV